MTTELDRRLLNDFQHEFPLTRAPYADMARELGVSEDEVIARLRELNQAGAKLAHEAARQAEKEDGKRRFVAGALGPTNRTASISPDVNGRQAAA